ncbi:MAG: metalloregulator ArsR/SmtB family transcription factor [Vicinamibacterales bacterium]|nr:metalloregulator ArsR/SmtB family transcription factor [Vicinamibacterales bacterium]
MKEASALFRLLGDEARLRLLRLLAKERLNVSELTAVLGIAQSGVSRHLGLLRDAGLVTEEREGGFTFFRATQEEKDRRLAPVWTLLRTRFRGASRDPLVRGDEARLRDVLRRRLENVETHGGELGAGVRQVVPGRSWAAWSRGLGLLLPPLTVGDLGCGEGYLTFEIARWAGRVVAVDRSARVLERARRLAARRRIGNVEWRRGEIEKLPLDTGAVDVALLSQALHHAHDPQRAVAEATRVVVDGGRVLVLDLRAHNKEWMRERLGDRWLGFGTEAVIEMMDKAGLVDVRARPVTDDTEHDPFGVLAAVGTKPRRGDDAVKETGQR